MSEVARPGDVTGDMNIVDGLRVGDEHRNRVISHLEESYAKGFLEEHEMVARRNAAIEAVEAGHLTGLLADLPQLPPAHRAERLAQKRDKRGHWSRNPVKRGAVHLAGIPLALMIGIITTALVMQPDMSAKDGATIAGAWVIAIIAAIGDCIWWYDWYSNRGGKHGN